MSLHLRNRYRVDEVQVEAIAEFLNSGRDLVDMHVLFSAVAFHDDHAVSFFFYHLGEVFSSVTLGSRCGLCASVIWNDRGSKVDRV